MKTVGIDGCKAGWIAISLDEESAGYWVIRSDEELKETFEKYDRIFIDIPIGIADDEYVRTCDEQLRKELGPDYSSSVFNPPIRSALYAPTYAEACMQSYSVTDKKVSLQSWNISPKIRVVDQLLQEDARLKDKVFESHPEMVFKRLNGGSTIYQKKQTSKGLKHRLKLLKDRDDHVADFYRNIKEEYRRNEVEEDDIVDAMALAYAAQKSENGTLLSLPEEPETDSAGLTMAIYYV